LAGLRKGGGTESLAMDVQIDRKKIGQKEKFYNYEGKKKARVRRETSNSNQTRLGVIEKNLSYGALELSSFRIAGETLLRREGRQACATSGEIVLAFPRLYRKLMASSKGDIFFWIRELNNNKDIFQTPSKETSKRRKPH